MTATELPQDLTSAIRGAHNTIAACTDAIAAYPDVPAATVAAWKAAIDQARADLPIFEAARKARADAACRRTARTYVS